MSDYASVADLYDKVDWEGGVAESIFGYGILAESLPDDVPDDIVHAWEAVQGQTDNIRLIQDYLYDHADDGREYD